MPKNIAVKLMKKYNTNDPFVIAEHKNINVIFWHLHKEVAGFYKYIRRNRFIFLNKSLPEQLSYFVCSHELGHALQHPRISTPFIKNKTLFSVDRIEVEANKFAVELLMPDDLIREYSHLTIYEIAKIANVPQEVVHLKDYEFS